MQAVLTDICVYITNNGKINERGVSDIEMKTTLCNLLNIGITKKHLFGNFQFLFSTC